MRLKGLLAGVIFCLTMTGVYAQKISEQEARERVLQYLDSNSNSFESKRVSGRGVKLSAAKVEADGIYAFNMDGGGYIIASADARTLPVLGYSDNGCLDWENMPYNMRAWLKSYDDAIATLSDRKDYKDGNCLSIQDGTAYRSPSRTERSAVEPLIKTKWDQGEPYWNQIPLYQGAVKEWVGKNCYTGCVATTMAQIMYYYKWPKGLTAAIPGYEYVTQSGDREKVWSIDGLPPVTFNWGLMLDDYEKPSTKSHQKAVATLMLYCATAVEMQLTPAGSAAYDSEIAHALYKYFDYDASIYFTPRFSYGIDEWEGLIYDEIAAGRPVAYAGADIDSGHSFICDGYDGDGFFHINWGWGGYYDGYFSLSVLNTSTHGVGFSMDQSIVVGIQPALKDSTSQGPLYHANMYFPNEIAAPDTVNFYYSFSSNIYTEVTHDFAMGTIGTDGTLTPCFMGDSSDSIVYDYNWMVVVIDSTAIQPGETLELYPMVKFRNIPGSDWQVLASRQFAVFAGRTEAGDFFLNLRVPNLEITDVRVTYGNIGLNEECDLTFTVRNNGNIEYSDYLYLYPIYYGNIREEEATWDKPYTWGDGMTNSAYLRAGQEDDIVFVFNPVQSGVIELLMYATYSYEYVGSYIVTVKDPTGTPFISVEKTDIRDTHYFDIQGRRMNNAAGKGLFINGNRKYIIP